MTIKLGNIRITLFKFTVNSETKERTVKAIEKANSNEYKWQKAHFAMAETVIDDMLADPYWQEVILECAAAR